MSYSLAAVKALIEKDKKILFITQRLKSGKIVYDLPGGKVENNENPYQTLKREVKEEMGIEININKPIGMFWFHNEKLDMQIICTVFKCSQKTHNINIMSNPADEDILNYYWLEKEEILNSEIIDNKSLKDLLIDYF
jgi:8-oxo-dGTP diphosphatase